MTFSTSELTNIRHGYDSTLLYGDKGWSEFSLEEKQEFLATASFSLYIRLVGETEWMTVELHPFYSYDSAEDVMSFFMFKVFPKNTFDPGTYEFWGVWYLEEYGNSETWSYENTVTVTVLP